LVGWSISCRCTAKGTADAVASSSSLLCHTHPFGCQSLTAVQLRDSWGQPTMRVFLHCFKGSHQRVLLKQLSRLCQGAPTGLHRPHRPPKDLINRGSDPLLCLSISKCCRVFPSVALWEILGTPCVKRPSLLQARPLPTRKSLSQRLSRPPALSRSVATASCHGLVIQQLHSSVGDLAITRGGKPHGWEICREKQMHRRSAIRGLQEMRKGGD